MYRRRYQNPDQKQHHRSKYSNGSGDVGWGALLEAIWKRAVSDEKTNAKKSFGVKILSEKTIAKIQQNLLSEADGYCKKSPELIYIYANEKDSLKKLKGKIREQL